MDGYFLPLFAGREKPISARMIRAEIDFIDGTSTDGTRTAHEGLLILFLCLELSNSVFTRAQH